MTIQQRVLISDGGGLVAAVGNQAAKHSYTVRHVTDRKSAGGYRRAHPVRPTYMIASTIQRFGRMRGLPRRPGTP